jgi:hypothetical protein
MITLKVRNEEYKLESSSLCNFLYCPVTSNLLGPHILLDTLFLDTLNSYVGIATRLPTGWTIGVLGFDSRWGLGIFLFTTASRTALGPTQSPIQWVPGDLSLGIKRPGREADHSPSSRAEVKNTAPPIRLQLK